MAGKNRVANTRHAFTTKAARLFSAALLRWYDANKRDLPWRRDSDPYRVWVSEIMLQQTRVAAVLVYYERFLRRFPDIASLARAREQTVLALWSGLGYYRRARFMHAAARVVVNELGGKLPSTANELARLPGIGRYTAAAIASIAFGEPCAVVDGNVERVLERVTGDAAFSTASAWDAAQKLLTIKRPGDFNQAMMELGATVCAAEQPRCCECPVARWCATRAPVQRGRSAVRKKKDVAYLLLRQDGSVYVVQRGPGSLMPGLWELPETTPDVQAGKELFQLRHSITDTDYQVRVFEGSSAELARGRWVPVKRLESFALTGLTRKILRKACII